MRCRAVEWGLYVWCGAEGRFVLFDTYPSAMGASLAGEAMCESYVVAEVAPELAVS